MKDIAESQPTELSTAFDAARAAYLDDPYPSYATRKDRLTRLEQGLLRFADRLEKAMVEDFSHRSLIEVSMSDITLPLGDIRMNRRHLKKWMKPRRYPMVKHMLPASGKVIPQPKGVVGVISPWNFPVYLAIAPIAAAMAAGNRVLLKPSELSPRTSEVLKQMADEVFDPTELSVHLGGPEVAKEFSELPFNHILFTGSTQVGRLVAGAAAKNLTPVTLELGGKSPAIVGLHGDVKKAATRVSHGKTVNAGQVCVSPDYALVPRARVREFAEEVKTTMQQFFGDFATSKDYTAMISERHRQRIRDLVAEAEERGTEVIRVGDATGAEARKEAPVLLIDPPLDLRVMQEEVFGPILSIIPYDTIEEAKRFVAERPSPLALYIFTEDKAERDDWLFNSLAGGVCVNETSFHVGADTMPFGGVGESGMGAYHGHTGFETFSHLKSVFYQSRFSTAFMFNPPTTGFHTRVLALLRKII